MRGWGVRKKGRGEPGIYAKKRSEKLPRVEGSDCIILSRLTGVSPTNRRPKGAEEGGSMSSSQPWTSLFRVVALGCKASVIPGDRPCN